MLDGSHHLRGVGVFVVIPCDDLHLSCAVTQRHNHGLRGVKQRAIHHADGIAGNNFIFVVAIRLICCSFHCGVNLVNGDIAINNSHKDGGGAGGNGYTLGGANQLAVQLRDDQTDSLGSTGGIGNDIFRGGTRSAQITLALAVGSVNWLKTI